MAPLLVGLLASVGVLLAFGALATGSRASTRLERYTGNSSASLNPAAEDRPGLLERISGGRLLARADRIVERRDWGSRLAAELVRADLALRPIEFVALWLAAALGTPALVMVVVAPLLGQSGNPLPVLVGLAVGLYAPRYWLKRRKTRRVRAFESRLPDTITLLSSGLRAGSSFMQSVELIVRETEPPMSVEFSRLIRDINVGLPLDDALLNLQQRVPSADLGLMTTAITIQHTVGGNLAEILDTIAFTIRERIRIHGEIRVLTSQQRLSGYVVAALPLGIIGVLSLIAPSYLAPLLMSPPTFVGLPLGMLFLAVGGVMMLIGFAAIRKIVDIKV
jgi:tight adherence protein B